MDFMIYPLAFLVLLGVLVTFHELGHYVVARWSGVQILKFSIGFGRAIWSKTDRRGTEWALAIIPFGGYVRMLDDRDPEQAGLLRPGERAYMDLHPRWRIAIAIGGPLANFILAIVVFFILQMAGSFKVAPTTAVPAADTPIATSGLTTAAEVISVDGQRTDDWQQVALALTRRLGDSGIIALQVHAQGDAQPRTLNIPIQNWHQGVGDPDVIRSLGLEPSLQALIGEVIADTPASAAGLKKEDWIIAADRQPIENWYGLVEIIEANPDRNVELTIVRDGVALNTLVRPGRREGDETKGFLGVGPKNRFVSASVSEAIPYAFVETWEKSGLILSILGKMVTGDVSVKNLSGPISIAQVAGDSAQYGWRQFFGILAFLSISLGVLNLLPIPVLDGGHVVFSSIEWVIGRPLPEQVQIWGVQIGLVLVGCMVVFATYNDVLRLF